MMIAIYISIIQRVSLICHLLSLLSIGANNIFKNNATSKRMTIFITLYTKNKIAKNQTVIRSFERYCLFSLSSKSHFFENIDGKLETNYLLL